MKITAWTRLEPEQKYAQVLAVIADICATGNAQVSPADYNAARGAGMPKMASMNQLFGLQWCEWLAITGNLERGCLNASIRIKPCLCGQPLTVGRQARCGRHGEQAPVLALCTDCAALFDEDEKAWSNLR